MGVYDGLQVQTLLDPAEQPFLHDHQIDGTPVLPGVMAMEAFAEMASLVCPELAVLQLENVELQAPFKFYRAEPRTLYLSAQFELVDEDVLAHCRCDSRRTLHGQEDEQVTTHFLATVRLGAAATDLGITEVPDAPDGPTLGADDLYQVYFHGPAYQVLTESWRRGEQIIGQMKPGLPPNHRPEERTLTTAPRLLELCFQTAGSWEIGTTGKMALPQRIGRVRFNGTVATVGQVLQAVVTPRTESGHFDSRVVDGEGRILVALEDYQSIEYPGAIEEALHAPFRAAMVREKL
jgi:hypothetical protein